MTTRIIESVGIGCAIAALILTGIWFTKPEKIEYQVKEVVHISRTVCHSA